MKYAIVTMLLIIELGVLAVTGRPYVGECGGYHTARGYERERQELATVSERTPYWTDFETDGGDVYRVLDTMPDGDYLLVIRDNATPDDVTDDVITSTIEL